MLHQPSQLLARDRAAALHSRLRPNPSRRNQSEIERARELGAAGPPRSGDQLAVGLDRRSRLRDGFHRACYYHPGRSFKLGPLLVDPAARRATVREQDVRLTRKELPFYWSWRLGPIGSSRRRAAPNHLGTSRNDSLQDPRQSREQAAQQAREGRCPRPRREHASCRLQAEGSPGLAGFPLWLLLVSSDGGCQSEAGPM